MKSMLNCWEFMRCGREPGGRKAGKMGVCPAAVDTAHNGLNRGTNGGRICWAVAGTLCGGRIHSEFAQKIPSCMSCKFYTRVRNEEGRDKFTLLMPCQIYPQNPGPWSPSGEPGLPMGS